MAGMDVRDLRKMPDEELMEALEEQKHKLFNLRFQKVSGEVRDTTVIPQIRRDVARLKMVLHERRLAAQQVSDEVNNG